MKIYDDCNDYIEYNQLLDRCLIVVDIIESQLLEHSVTKNNKEIENHLLKTTQSMLKVYELLNQNIEKEKNKYEKELSVKNTKLKKKLEIIEYKNKLLSGNPDLDYLDTLYRAKFKFGKKNEVLIKLNQ